MIWHNISLCPETISGSEWFTAAPRGDELIKHTAAPSVTAVTDDSSRALFNRQTHIDKDEWSNHYIHHIIWDFELWKRWDSNNFVLPGIHLVHFPREAPVVLYLLGVLGYQVDQGDLRGNLSTHPIEIAHTGLWEMIDPIHQTSRFSLEKHFLPWDPAGRLLCPERQERKEYMSLTQMRYVWFTVK